MEDFIEDHPLVSLFIAVFILLVSGFLLTHLHWNIGESVYTGYIYSAEDGIAATTGHLRYSLNAGADEQPSFCVNKGTDASKLLKELAGSGKKVRVTVPAGFSIVAPWACAFPAEIEVEE